MLRKEGTRATIRPRARVSARPRMSASQARSSFMAQNAHTSSSNTPKEKYSRFSSITQAYQTFLAFLESGKALALNPTLWRSVLRSTVFFLVSANLYATSWGTYATFYARYIPVLTSVTPIYFNFGKNPPSTKFPAVYNDRPTLFEYGQPYDITLELDIPESDSNLDLGNFMVRLELQNRAGRDLYVSERPTLVVYRSVLLRRLSTLVYSIPLLLDMKSERRVLKIPLAEGFMDDYDDIITDVELMISNPNIQIYSSRLRIDAHLTGLRYVMYHWSTLTAGFFTTFFFIAEIVFCLVAWQLGVYLWGRLQIMEQAEEAAEAAAASEAPTAPLGGSEVGQPESQQVNPDSPIAMPHTEEEEWERLSNSLSTGALTPPGMTPLDQTPQNAASLASLLRYRANYSQSPTQSFVRGEDSNLDMDLLRFMSQAQNHLTTSSSLTEVDLERQTGTLVDFGSDKDNDRDIGEGPSTNFYPTPASEATVRGRYATNKKSQ